LSAWKPDPIFYPTWDSSVVAVRQNPDISENKKDDLAMLPVFKFRSGAQLYLLG